jgi:hypothetical protein
MITNELISEIKSKINDNQKQAITGGVLQGVLVDMVNGLTTKGLTFLGLLGPGDPAPSNEPTGGYYLSFQASTNGTPYFNGVYLHRYCLLIWTQDERDRWKFKKIKYEDHRPAPAVVVGRKVPIIAYIDGHYKLRLGNDGMRLSYMFFGPTNLRIEQGYPYIGRNRPMGKSMPCVDVHQICNFPLEDNGRIFKNIQQVKIYLEHLKHVDYSYPLSTKNYSRIGGEVRWTPQHWKRKAVFIRRYYGMGSFDPQSKYKNNRIPIRVSMVSKHYIVTPKRPLETAIELARNSTPDNFEYGMLYAAKRLSVKIDNDGTAKHVHASGYSYNSIPFGQPYGRYIRVNVNSKITK